MAERFTDSNGNVWEKVSSGDNAVGACLVLLIIGIELALALFLLPGISVLMLLTAIGIPQGWWCSVLYSGAIYYVLYVKSYHVKRDVFIVILVSAILVAIIYWLMSNGLVNSITV